MKRFLAVILSVTLLLVSMPTVGAKAPETETNEYVQAFNFIKDLGLLEGNDINATDTIIRKDIAELVVNAMGLSKYASPVDTEYLDVKSDEEKSGYIAIATTCGILNGFSDGRFLPNDTISFNQAVKIIVGLVGYNVYAQNRGGYPMGYLAIASELGITYGIALKGDEVITYGEVCYMLKKAIADVEILERGAYGAESEYITTRGKTILNSKLDIYKIRGQVTANYFTTLAGSSTLNKNEIQIDSIVYKIKNSDWANFLGKTMTFYIHEENVGADVVLAYDCNEGDNAELIITDENIISINDTCIEYFDDSEKTKSADIAINAYLVYNGKAKLAWSAADIPAGNCIVRLLDSDSDNEYDVVFVDSYLNYVVTKVQEVNNTVYFKTNDVTMKSLSLDEEDDAIKFSIKDKDGNDIALKDLKKWNILSIAKNGEVYKIVVCTETLTGTCVSIGDGEVGIDETVYKIDEQMFYNTSIDVPELNKPGNFYFDFRGRIAAVESADDASYQYGYVIKMGSKDSKQENMAIKLYTQNGEFVIYDMAGKVRLNGSLVAKEDLMGEAELVTSGNVKNQLIKFSLNESGEINKIQTPKNGADYERDDRLKIFTKDLSLSSNRYFGGNMKMFASRYVLSPDTIIFAIPPASEIENEHMYAVLKNSDLRDGQTYNNVNIYNVDEENIAESVTIEMTNNINLYSGSPVGVVKGVMRIYDKDKNESLTKISLIGSSGEIELIPRDVSVLAYVGTIMSNDDDEENVEVDTSGNMPLSSLEPGDIIRYAVNAEGELTYVFALMRGSNTTYKEQGPSTLTADYSYASIYYAYAEVESVLSYGLRVTVPSPDQTTEYERIYPYYSLTKFVKVNRATKSIKPISADDIVDGDDVFAFLNGANVKLVVVYE